jgi:hypothetical protein
MLIDADRIIFTPTDRSRIGQTVCVMSGLPMDMGVIIENSDVDAMIAAGIIKELKAPPKIQT